MTAKKLSPERIAAHGYAAPLLPYPGPEAVLELLGHIEALEAELKDANEWYATELHISGALRKELAESKAECERLRDELGRVRRLSELGWDVTEVGALKAQIRDRDTLLKNENESYRRCAEECERLRAELGR